MLHARSFHKLGIAVGVLVAVGALAFLASGFLRASADTGGPAGGYTWFDSNDPEPKVMFEAMPISIPPFARAVGEDDEFSTVDLPFTFNFFGTDFTQVDISTNGFLSFDSAMTATTTSTVPTATTETRSPSRATATIPNGVASR